MVALAEYEETVERILNEHAALPYAYGDVRTQPVFDRERGRFALINVGWDLGERVHSTLVHVELIDGKIWIHHDGTEQGIASELVDAGVAKSQIVLAFRPPELRVLGEYANA